VRLNGFFILTHYNFNLEALMRNKSLVFLALILLGVVGCNKEATSAKETEGTKEITSVSTTTDQQNKEAPATSTVVTTTEAKPATSK
jgi:outer membrane receptor for ferrienterochelin and colicin